MKDKKQPQSARGDETARFEAEVKRVSERMSKNEPSYRGQEQPKRARADQNSGDTAKEPRQPNAPKDPEQITLQREQVRIANKGWRTSILAIVLQTIGLIMAGAAVAIGLVGIWDKLTKIQIDVKRNHFVITSPHNGAEVGVGQKIRGDTPFPNPDYSRSVEVRARTGHLGGWLMVERVLTTG